MKLRALIIPAFPRLSAGLAITLLACSNGGSSAPAPPKEDASSATAPASDGYVTHLEPAPGVRFPMPAMGVSARVFDYDATLPAEKFRHEIDIGTDEYVQILIHVWDNPAHLDTQAWFSENMSGFVDHDTAVSERSATKRKAPSIVLEQPASEQAVSQAVAIFATHDHVYSVTVMDPANDSGAKKLFDRVVTDFEPEVNPSITAPATQAAEAR